MSRFYITTAIPYANGAPHIGHAYERIATDAIQRFMRLDGRDTLFVTGMDEYGLKVQQTAAKEGVTPQAFVDRVAAEFEAMGELLNARADDIVRTTQGRNVRAAQAIWERMAANGDVYLSKYSGWYSVRDEAYFVESELSPGPEGTKLAPSGAPVDWVEEESWFFRLSAYADRLLAHYAAHPEFVTPEKYLNEIVAFVKRGLSDLSISRATLAWGTPVPGEFLKQVAELAAFAVRVLVRSGICAVMTGQYYFAEVMRSLGERLTWQWMRAMTWAGDSPPIHRLHVTNHWKPTVIFSKGDWRGSGRWSDHSHVTGKEKDWHPCQQPLAEAEEIARIFTSPGDLVVDPCGGGFTTAVACKRLGRRCISCDIDEQAVLAGQARLKGTQAISG